MVFAAAVAIYTAGYMAGHTQAYREITDFLTVHGKGR